VAVIPGQESHVVMTLGEVTEMVFFFFFSFFFFLDRFRSNHTHWKFHRSAGQSWYQVLRLHLHISLFKCLRFFTELFCIM